MRAFEQTDTLVIGKNLDVLLTRYISFQSDTPFETLRYNPGVDMINCEVYDNLGALDSKLNGGEITVRTRRKIGANQKLTLKFKILVRVTWQRLGDLYILTWSAVNLFEVKLSDPTFFQISGFAKIKGDRARNPRIFTASKNLSAKFKDHMVGGRGIIIAVSKIREPKFRISLLLDFNNRGESSIIRNLKLATPQSDVSKSSRVITLRGFRTNPKTTTDEQGNTILNFEEEDVPPGSSVFEVVSEVSLKPNPVGFDLTDLGKMSNLKAAISRSEKGAYFTTSVKGAFELNHPIVQKYAKAAMKKETVFEAHRLLFELANRQLTYQISEGRRSSTWALESGVGDCSEFSYLLVALHRAAGIPSRVVEGNIVDKEGLVGHGWVEFLSPSKGWIECDPTWGLVLGTSPLHIRYVNHQSGDSPAYIAFEGNNQIDIDWKFRLDE